MTTRYDAHREDDDAYRGAPEYDAYDARGREAYDAYDAHGREAYDAGEPDGDYLEFRAGSAGGRSAASRGTARRRLDQGFRRALGLTFLGSLIPGAGLTRTRHARAGWFLLTVALLSGVVLGYVVMTKGIKATLLEFVSNTTALEIGALVLVGGGLAWAASVVLTAMTSRPDFLDRARTGILAAFSAVMVTVIAASSFQAADYLLVTKDTLNGLFGTAKPGEGAKVSEGEDPWAETPRVTMLLLGSDAGVGRTNTRTDSMVVASIDTKTGQAVLISLPRNLQQVPLPEDSNLREWYPSGVYGEPECFRLRADKNDPCMLNAIWVEADEYKAEHPESYADEASPGRFETRQVIEEVVGLEIDHTVVIDLKGFSQLVDAMGGIDINVRGGGYDGEQKLPYGQKLSDGSYSKYFEPGPQHLSGYQALWYARTRAADDDNHRQARQRCVIKAVVDQVNPAKMLGQYAEIAQIAQDNIYTDIPGENLSAFVELIQRVQKADKIKSLPLTISNGARIQGGGTDYERIHELVQKAIAPPKPKPTPAPTATSTESDSADAGDEGEDTSEPTSTKTPSPTETTEEGAQEEEC